MGAHTRTQCPFDTSSSTANVKPGASKANLVDLPPELRQQIFRHYFQAAGGYAYDGETDRLVTADGSPIDLSLMYTCRSIADDTKHIPLGINTITFSTTYREDWRQQAGGLAFILNYHRLFQAEVVVKLSRLITPEMYCQLGLQFPQAMPVIRKHVTQELERLEQSIAHRRIIENMTSISQALEALGTLGTEPLPDDTSSGAPEEGWFGNSLFLKRGLSATAFYDGILADTYLDLLQDRWGETSFSASTAVAYTFRLLAEKHPDEVALLIDQNFPGWTDSHSLDEFSELSFEPWAIPPLSEIVARGTQLQAQEVWDALDEWYNDLGVPHSGSGNRCREKLYFSAAAVAIRFLNRLPESQRLYLRNIVVDENRISVGFPECHALGLIPFCRENPRLRVRRSVNIWRTIPLKMKIPGILLASVLFEDPTPRPNSSDNNYDTRLVATELRPWVLSALEAVDMGLPASSFSFVLDGDPDINLSSELFDTVIHPGVAWEKAHREILGPREDTWNSKDGARGIEPLFSRHSIFQSNFNLGQPWDYTTLIEEHKNPSTDSWQREFKAFTTAEFEVSNPAIDEIKLVLELYEHEKPCDYLDSSHNISKKEKKRLRRVRRRWATAIAAQKSTQGAEAEKGNASDSDRDSNGITGELMKALFCDGHEVSSCMTSQELQEVAQE